MMLYNNPIKLLRGRYPSSGAEIIRDDVYLLGIREMKYVGKYCKNLIDEKILETGPEISRYNLQTFYQKWKDGWLEEFLSDLFALYTVGPAYAFAYLHLCTKMSDNVFKLSTILPQSHPSDDARMKLLFGGLEMLDFKKESIDLKNKWNSLPFVKNFKPASEYNLAFPRKMMMNIAELFAFCHMAMNRFP